MGHERESKRIIGGNIEVNDFQEFAAWEETLQNLGFTDEEIAHILASNQLVGLTYSV